jgi:hypothetical protein
LSHSSQIWATHFVPINPAQSMRKGVIIAGGIYTQTGGAHPKKAEKRESPKLGSQPLLYLIHSSR